MPTKPIEWIGSSLESLRHLEAEVRDEIGFALWQVQQGFDPPDWKPMSSVGFGVREIRIHAGQEIRVTYVANFPEAVYVLHVFMKKSSKTSRRDLNLIAARFREMLRGRRSRIERWQARSK